MKKRSWPSWWNWELEFTPHLYKRMDDRNFNEDDRNFNELDLRTMLERAHAYREDVIEGRWIIETRYRNRTWEIIVEPTRIMEKINPQSCLSFGPYSVLRQRLNT